jgi:hypothetical protein
MIVPRSTPSDRPVVLSPDDSSRCVRTQAGEEGNALQAQSSD